MSQEVAGSSPAGTAKLYVVGRADLPAGLRVAQMFHAARAYASEFPHVESDWYRRSNTIVLLEVPDRQALEDLLYKATDITHAGFEEEGIEGPTALCLGPDARKLVSSIPLALKSTSAPRTEPTE